jgi:hypothetical protein
LESLARKHVVSVLVRDRAKLEATLPSSVGQLHHVSIGDVSDSATVRKAITDAGGPLDCVFLTQGARPDLAKTVAHACKELGVMKLVAVAGGTNLHQENGVDFCWTLWKDRWAGAEGAFKAHGAVIEEIRKANVNYAVFCPGFMKSVGKKSSPPPTMPIDRPGADFTSYEDAGWVCVNAAMDAKYDRVLFAAK